MELGTAASSKLLVSEGVLELLPSVVDVISLDLGKERVIPYENISDREGKVSLGGNFSNREVDFPALSGAVRDVEDVGVEDCFRVYWDGWVVGGSLPR